MIDLNNIQNDHKFDADKTVYVLMHKDCSHVFPDPTDKTQPYWSYDEKAIDVVLMSMRRDFKNRQYVKTTLATAISQVGKRQDELMHLWQAPMKQIKNCRTLEEKFEIYRRAKRAFKQHPLLLDTELKLELKII